MRSICGNALNALVALGLLLSASAVSAAYAETRAETLFVSGSDGDPEEASHCEQSARIGHECMGCCPWPAAATAGAADPRLATPGPARRGAWGKHNRAGPGLRRARHARRSGPSLQVLFCSFQT